MPPVFRLDNLKKGYAGRMVVDIDSLEIQPGEIFALVGPSGAGKSTLLRLLNFLEYADDGRLLFAEKAVTPDLPLEVRRRVTTVFQKPALLNDSVEKNVAYGLQLRGIRNNKDIITDTLSRIGLEKLRNAPARTLSGGEAQRVALARAIILRPDVLLLDEPTANLDPFNISLIEEVVREINTKYGTTIILVTHNIFQAKRLASRIGLILNGHIVEVASTHAFFENPHDPRTRAFVNGEMAY
jgi:tungstate transport system ATP-binding protein